jgi:tetratricopeptide (TPR) repeat protein
MQRRVVALTLGLCGAVGLAEGADKWLEVRTDNFTVVSNAGEGRLRKTATEFEQVRAAYATVWPDLSLVSGKPVVVLALKNEGTMKRWAPEYFEGNGRINVVSVSIEGADRAYLLLRTDSRPDDADVTPNYNLYRSYLTLLLSGAFERPLPLWLANGFADVLGNTSVHDDEILMGRLVPWMFQHFVDNPRIPLSEILEADRDSPLFTQELRRRAFDAHCYVLVHYLLFDERAARSGQLTRFQELWQAGHSREEAWAEAFGDVRSIEDALPNYARSPILSFAKFPVEVKLDEQRLEGRRLAPVEVSGLQAAVHVAMGRPEEARAALGEARSADPESPLSYDAEGLLADRNGDDAAAAAAYARAVELGTPSAHSHYRAAQLAWAADADAAALARRRSLLERAIELNPAYADAYSFLAETLLDQDENEAALARAERAVTLEPGDSYPRLALGKALHAVGRDAEARESAELGLQLAGSERQAASARRFLEYLERAAAHEQARQREELARVCSSGDSAACVEVRPQLESACGQGDGHACMLLGWLYRGNGLPEDVDESLRLMTLACERGDRNGCVERAWAVARGLGVTVDEPGAIATLEALCDEGVVPGCTRLGMILASRSTASDRERGLALFGRACEAGDRDACRFAEQLE